MVYILCIYILYIIMYYVSFCVTVNRCVHEFMLILVIFFIFSLSLLYFYSLYKLNGLSRMVHSLQNHQPLCSSYFWAPTLKQTFCLDRTVATLFWPISANYQKAGVISCSDLNNRFNNLTKLIDLVFEHHLPPLELRPWSSFNNKSTKWGWLLQQY